MLTSLIISSLHAQCPTVTNSLQSFCDIEPILVENLVATDNGGGVVWYDTLSSTTALLNIEGLIDGEDYYADDNTGTCGPRQRVDVIIYGPPDGLNFQGFCLDESNVATIADLIATGNNVQWYLTQTGGVPLPDSTILIDNSIYYADQENPDTGCKTSRLSVLVNVGLTPVPTGDSIQEFCVTPNSTPIVEDLIASGINNWYISLFSASPLPSSTPLINGQVYYASTIDPPCESSGRLAVLVLLTNSPDPGMNSTLDLCENASSIDLFTVLGGSPDSGGTWSPSLNSGTGIFDPSIDPQGVYTYTVDAVNVCPEQSATVTVTLIPEPLAGTNGSIDLCTNSAIIDLFDSLGGLPETGGTWSPILTSGTGVYDPSVDTGGVYTYTVSGTAPCLDASASVTVLLSTITDAGEDASIEICDDIGTIDLFNSLGGTPDTGGSWSPLLASGTGIFDPSIDPEGTYTYTVFGTPPCVDDSANVVITISELADPGTDAAIQLCSNSATIDLFTSLGGSPEVGGIWSPILASGTGIFDASVDPEGLYTYSIASTTACSDVSSNVNVSVETAPEAGEDASIEICDDNGLIDLFESLGGTPDTGGTWFPTLTSGTGIFDPNTDTEGIYTYIVSGTPPCNDDSANVTITVSELPDAGADATVQLCANDGTIDLFNSLGGSPDTGGTWSPSLTSGTGVFDPSIDSEGVYSYSISSTTACSDVSSNVDVSVEIAPEAGEDGSIEICDDNGLIDLFDSLGGAPDTGGVWSPTLLSGTGVFDPNSDTEGTYEYTVSGSPPCADAFATVTITISESPDTGTDAAIQLCSDNGTVDLINSLGGTPDTGGTWSPTLTSGTGIFDPSIDAEGIYTYSISGSSVCADASSNVNISVEIAPEAGENTSIEVCDNIGTINLFNSLDGTPDVGGTWFPELASGTNIFDPSLDPDGTYTYTVFGTSPCIEDSASISITVSDAPNAGTNSSIDICNNSAVIDLFDSLGGTPETGGTWSPTLTSGTGVFDPSIDAEGIYTYTLTGLPPCGDTSAAINITLSEVPNAGLDASITVCRNGDSIDLFDSIGGSPDTGGNWSPSLNSGTGVFDPSIDLEGTYTYTISGTSPCPDASTDITITITDSLDAGENGTVSFCRNEDPTDLFDALEGSPQLGGVWSPTLTSGTGIFDPSIDPEDIYTYTLSGATAPCLDDSATVNVTLITEPNAGENGSVDICDNGDIIFLFDFLQGTPQPGGTWSPALVSGTDEFNPAVDPADQYTYTIAGIAPCSDASAIVEVTIIVAVADAGENGSVEVCINSDIIFLFNFLEGSPQSGGTWSPELPSGTDEFNPAIDPAGQYTYTIADTAPCDDDSAAVTVSIIPEPNAGIDSAITICIDAAASDLFNAIGGTPDSNGIWSPALNSGTGVFDPSIDLEGTYTYTVTSTDCNLMDMSSVQVTIGEKPDVSGAVLASEPSICIGFDISVELSGANQLIDRIYTIDYLLTGTNTASNTIDITVSGGNASFLIASNLIQNSGITFITITGFYFVGEFCSGDTDLIALLEITILETQTPQISDESSPFCIQDSPTIANLNNNIIDSEPIIWYNLPENGIAYSDSDLLQDGVTYYAAIQGANGCESTVRLAVTASVIECLYELTVPDGFSPNGDSINDDFHIVNLDILYPNFKLSVYNRYGNILYEGNIDSQRWDGTSKTSDKVLPLGVYFYILEFNDGERNPIQGRVYLSR